MTILELLAGPKRDRGARWRKYENALRRIATDFAPGDEPMLGDYQGPSGTPEPGRFLLAHGRWQALTEVQAAILEELQR